MFLILNYICISVNLCLANVHDTVWRFPIFWLMPEKGDMELIVVICTILSFLIVYNFGGCTNK